MKVLNYHLVKKVEEFFLKHDMKIEKKDETVVVETIPTKTNSY
jgi:hypothetical protein